MADPVSLLGTLPALVTLPAVTLQAVQTIQNFSKSLKNATIDVQQLLNEVEMIQTLLQNIRAQCDPAIPQGVEHNDLQDLLQVIGLLNERIEAPLKELRELRESMKKPSRTSFNITSRIRKYLSEAEVKDHLDHLLRLVVTLHLIYLKTDAIRMQQLHEKTDAIQQDVQILTQRLPNPNASTGTVPQPLATNIQKEVSLYTRSERSFPRRARKRSKCIQGLCGCLCHRISNYQRSWFVSGHTACFVACGCADRNYQWTVSLFGRLITFKAGFRDNGETSIGWNISPSNSVPRTSPGFVVIEKCKLGTLKASEASRDLRVLLSSGVISVKDQNPDGESYIDFLLRGPWMHDAGNQLELLKTLAHNGFFWENDKLLRYLLSWVGEGPHLDLFNTMLSLFDFTQGFRPETMTEWPRPFDPGFVQIFRYADVLFLKVVAGLATEDPDFGGTTPLQAAILSNNVDAVEKLLSPVPPSDIFARNFLGQSALHLAVRNPRMVSLLLDAGYSSHVDVTDQHGITPLIYAAGYGFIETMKVLLMAGADPYRRDELTHMSMWHYVLFCHKSEFVKELLGFYMATKHETANSAVELCLWIRMICHHTRSTDYSCETLEYLLQIRSTERKSYFKKYSLLHLCWNISEAQLLLKYRCDGVNHRNIQGYTPMMVLTRLPAPAGALQMLVEQSANLSIRDDHGMNALHHLNASVASFSSWGASRKDKWTDWLDAIAILISAGGDINKNDKCSCPCSSAGCSPIRGLFWEDCDRFASQENALEAIPWILELSLVLKHSGKQDSLAQAASEFHRFQTFEEWGMTHTCWIHGERDYHGPRPQVKFYSPHEDFRIPEGNESKNSEERLKESDDWCLEFAEITDEEKELAHRLDVECSNYSRMLDHTFEDRWIELLARRAILLEHQMKSCLANEQGGRVLKESMIGPELPPQELLISGSPLEYIDKQNDEFVPHFDFSEIFESLVKRKERNFEHYHDLFLNSFNTDLQTYTYMGGQTRQAWYAERKDLLSRLYQKVRHLRSIPLERRGWGVDLIEVDDLR